MKNRKSILVVIGLIMIFFIFIVCGNNKVLASDEEGNFVIVLDPGHGDKDPGAVAGGLREDQINFKLAYYAKQELEEYEGVKVYLTRYNDCPSIYDRVEIAKRYSADLLVSMHINSGASGNRGAAVWVTQDKTRVEFYQKASELASKILYHLNTVGVINCGVQTRSGRANEWYDSGVVQDYYGIIRYAQREKMRSILVEHCFISNPNDREYINSDEKIKKLAQADVKGIAETYKLEKKGRGFVPVKSMAINAQEVELQIQESDPEPITYLNAVFTPNKVTNNEVEWYSSDPSTVRVWEGKIRGLKEGEVIIKAISRNNQKIATCKVTVTKSKDPVQGLNFDKTEQTVNIDETGDILVDFIPANCKDKTLYWTSSDPETVRIWYGHFRGLKEGTAKITAMSKIGGKVASCIVRVKDPNKKYVEDITLEKENYIIDVDEAMDLPYTYTPIDSTNANFVWSSSDESVLRVYGNRIRGLKEGTADIIVKTEDGMFQKNMSVTVKKLNKNYVQSINVEKSEYKIRKNEAVDIPFTYSPENCKNAEFEWSSSNSEILRVYGNRFRGLKEGTAYVIARTKDGTVEKKIKVVIREYRVETINVEKSNYTISINEAVDIPFTYSPENSINAEFEWSSSNSEILRVYENRFRGLKEGTAYVIARTKDGTVEKRMKVVIQDPNKDYVKEIKLDKDSYVLDIDEAINLPYTYAPINSSNANFVWSSSDENILRVYGNRVRGLKEGTANIVIKTQDEMFEKEIKVTVKNLNKPYVQSINVDKDEYTIKINEAVDVPFTYSPENCKNAEFEWSSSNSEILRVYENRFRGLKEGTAYVMARTKDGRVKKEIKVIIEK